MCLRINGNNRIMVEMAGTVTCESDLSQGDYSNIDNSGESSTMSVMLLDRLKSLSPAEIS